MDLYEILEIKSTASEVEIKKAYLKLVKVYHPDRNTSLDASDKLQKIQSAYDILINNKSRQEYQKMNQTEKINFVEILEKIIKDKFNFEELKNYDINLENTDFNYIQNNFINFFKSINVGELLQLFRKGIVPKKNFDNQINCSESDVNIYDELYAEYHYNLPISFQKFNKLDIQIDLSIKVGDVINKNKRKIKIKRNINNEQETSTFIFNISSPYIIYVGAGDSNNGDYGNLIIKLNLPTNLFWSENIILIEQSMNLYEMIYGLDIFLDLGEDKKISIQSWIPSRDGFLIEISSNTNNKNIETNIILSNYNLGIKLFLNYEDTIEKEQLLKQYFS